MFCSRSFMVSGLTFTSLIHFEFILSSVRKCFNLILLQCSYMVFPETPGENNVFSPFYILPPLL